MSAQPEQVRVGNVVIVIRKDAKKRFWFAWTDEKRIRHRAFRWTLDEARTEAKRVGGLLKAGKVDLLSISPARLAAFVEWEKQQARSKTLSVVTADFLSDRAGLSDIYTRGLKSDLETFRDFLRDPLIAAIEPGDIEGFLRSLEVGPRRRNNIRSKLITLFRYARDRKFVAWGQTAPESVSREKEPRHEPAIFTPDEMQALLGAVRDVWLPWMALGAFAGVRTAEIARMTWHNVKWEQGHIDLPASSTKTSRRRVVPMRDNLVEWLTPWRDATGPVSTGGMEQHETRRLQRLGLPWRVNGLRHSYGTYRAAEIRNLPDLAYEMGNSVAMIKANYDAVSTKSEAEKFFSIRPASAPNIIRLPVGATT